MVQCEKLRWCEKMCIRDSHVTAPVLKEWGPVRTVMSISHRFAGSLVEQDSVFYPNLPRIDFVTRADWRDHHVLLRVYVPARINATKAAYRCV